METKGIISLANQLHKLFGQTEEERDTVRRLLREHPTMALEAIGFKVNTTVIEGFEQLNELG